MIFEQIPVGQMQNFSYLIGDEDSKEAAIVDPGWEVDKIINTASRHDLGIKFILITILKIKAGCNFSNFFRSNILHSLEKLSSSFDNLICFEILEYINNNENDLFTYNLDKNIFNLNIFTPLNKIT